MPIEKRGSLTAAQAAALASIGTDADTAATQASAAATDSGTASAQATIAAEEATEAARHVHNRERWVGKLAVAAGGKVTEEALRRAMLVGSVIASFNVEAFSLNRLRKLTRRDFARRITAFKHMLRI